MKSDFVRSDEELEALFSKYEMPSIEDLTCQAGKVIRRMCASPECKNRSLLCSDIDCPFCGEEKHEQCRIVSMKGVTKELSNLAGKQKDFSLDICRIEGKFIEELHKSNNFLVKKYELGSMDGNFLRILQEIYHKKNRDCLVGEQAAEFLQQLKSSIQNANSHSSALLERYNKALEVALEEILSLKEMVYQSFGKDKQRYLDSKIIYSPIDAKNDPITKEQLEFLLTSLDNPKKIELIFRASEHDFRAAIFHEKCGDVENTLTLVKTEFGKTIAAFTPYKWHSVPNKQFVSNPAGGCFILALQNREKLIPHQTAHLMQNDAGWGPLFGGSNFRDFVISDQCNINKSSGLYQYDTYNTKDKKFQNNQTAHRAISGATDGYKFTVLEYQVFKVVK